MHSHSRTALALTNPKCESRLHARRLRKPGSGWRACLDDLSPWGPFTGWGGSILSRTFQMRPAAVEPWMPLLAGSPPTWWNVRPTVASALTHC
jgi:hypothetical protein